MPKDWGDAANPMAAAPFDEEDGPLAQQFGQVEPQKFEGSNITIIERGHFSAEEVIEALKDVIDPELGINIVDLGLLYGVAINPDNSIQLDMTLTSAACPLTDVIERQTQMVLGPYTEDVRVNWVWLPSWGPECITSDGREQLRAIGFNI